MSTLKSEVLTLIAKDVAEMEKLAFTNGTAPTIDMADFYVIGVYGKKNTTFQISVGSSSQPLATLTEGVALGNR